MSILTLLRAGFGALLLSWTLAASASAAPAESRDPRNEGTYTAEEIVQKAADFFGVTTELIGKAVERVFGKYGRPNAYITGTEGSGAVGVGLRYGEGELYLKKRRAGESLLAGPVGRLRLRGQRLEIFTLIYNLPNPESIYERFPGVEGSAYFVAGHRRELSAGRPHHSGADAHRRGPTRRSECRLPFLLQGAELGPF